MRVATVLLVCVLSWAWGSVKAADEHTACRDLDFVYQNHTAEQIRAIAQSCHSDTISQLYFNRAYHMDLLQEGEALSQLIATSSGNITHHIESYRLYIALIESFAPSWYGDDMQGRITFLNREYDRRGEVTELRIRGYDRLADLKEKQLLLQ